MCVIYSLRRVLLTFPTTIIFTNSMLDPHTPPHKRQVHTTGISSAPKNVESYNNASRDTTTDEAVDLVQTTHQTYNKNITKESVQTVPNSQNKSIDTVDQQNPKRKRENDNARYRDDNARYRDERDEARKKHGKDYVQWKRIISEKNDEIRRLKDELSQLTHRVSQLETESARQITCIHDMKDKSTHQNAPVTTHQNAPVTIQNDSVTISETVESIIGVKRKCTGPVASTDPVSFQTFMSTMFAKIVSNLSTPCVQILRTSHQEVVVRCPKGVGIALEAKLNQYVLANVHIFKRAFRVNPESETFPDFFSNFKSADGQHVITQLELKCGKNGCFDLSRLELLFKNMSEPGGVYKKLFETMYIITFYRFDEHTGHVKPEPPVLKYIHELTGRSRTRINKTFEMMSIGGTSVNLRPTTCTINTYKDIGADRTRAGFVEIVLETLFSDHQRCKHIRKKISIREKGKKIEDCRWKWHKSIVEQVLGLQRRGLFTRVVRDCFKTNSIVHKTGLTHYNK